MNIDKLFLAHIFYYRSEYMIDGKESIDSFHIVQADNKVEAEERACKYIEDKTSEYSTYYRVNDVIVTEAII